MWSRTGLVVLSCAVVATPGTLWAQEIASDYPVDPETAPRPTVEARRTDQPIAIDGRLDESAWSNAVLITEFIQSQPDPGMPPTDRTVVRVLYDENRLYVGAMCYDSNPSELVITSLEHDFGAGSSTRDMDIFSITLDTFLDRRNSFIFLVSPGGAFRDGQTFNDSRQTDFAWRAIMQVETAITDSGYVVEMSIPWTTLRFDPSKINQDWGFNILRRVRRKNEDMYWAPLDRRDPVHRMSKAGTLRGLRGLQSGRNIQIKPYAKATHLDGRDVGTDLDGPDGDIGGDLKWGMTSGLTFDATVRTDFSQVEVDQEQVNLTRFPLFFPERRDFFVENSGSFILGDVTERNYRTGSSLRQFTLFHSRRIGLEQGRPIPIAAGGRVSGRAGDFEIGLLNMQTQRVDSLPGENFGVIRLRRNVGASDVGVMFVNRQGTGDLGSGEYNRSFAADANLRPVPGLLVNTYAARTTENSGTGDQFAGRVLVAWRDAFWEAAGFVKHVGEAFNPGVGFVRRSGIRHGYLTLGVHPRPSWRAVQELNPYSELHYVTDTDSELLTRRNVLGFGIEFQDGGTLNFNYENRYERLDEPATIGQVEVPIGRYTTNEGSVTFNSSRARSLSGEVRVSGGEFWDGHSLSVSGSATWRAHYKLSFDVSASHNDVRLEGGDFTADVYGARIRFAQSTRLFSSAFVQYNQQTDQLITNLRINWIYGPLSDVFLLLTERRQVGGSFPGVLDRAVTLKATRLLAF